MNNCEKVCRSYLLLQMKDIPPTKSVNLYLDSADGGKLEPTKKIGDT